MADYLSIARCTPHLGCTSYIHPILEWIFIHSSHRVTSEIHPTPGWDEYRMYTPNGVYTQYFPDFTYNTWIQYFILATKKINAGKLLELGPKQFNALWAREKPKVVKLVQYLSVLVQVHIGVIQVYTDACTHVRKFFNLLMIIK